MRFNHDIELYIIPFAAKVKVIEEEFLNVQHTDERLKHIKVVLLTTECSRSGIANPVNFIVNEGEGNYGQYSLY